MSGTPEHDDALLLAAAGGDEAAFERFYQRWLPLVLAYHLRRTRSPEIAFDLTAETFAAVVVSCSEFQPQLGSAPTWLFSIARNKLRDSSRRARVEESARKRLAFEPVTLEDEDIRRVEELACRGEDELLATLLSELPAEQRDAIRARVLDEQPYAAIASQLRCSEAVVRQRVHRGLGRLRERLEETA